MRFHRLVLLVCFLAAAVGAVWIGGWRWGLAEAEPALPGDIGRSVVGEEEVASLVRPVEATGAGGIEAAGERGEPLAAVAEARMPVPVGGTLGRCIELLIQDGEGAPVPFARVRYTFQGRNGSGAGHGTADASGVFMRELTSRSMEPHTFVVDSPPGWRERHVARVRDVAPGTMGLVVRLAEGPVLRLRLWDESGLPITKPARIMLLTGGRVLELQVRRPDDLRVRLIEAHLEVRVDADGYSQCRLGPFTPADAGAELDVVLSRSPGIHGIVLSRGQPVSNALVNLHEEVQARGGGAAARRPRLAGRLVAETRSDEQGRFVLSARIPGRYVLQAQARGHVGAELGPLQVDPEVMLEDLELELARTGSIEGVVLGPDGGPGSFLEVAALDEQGDPRVAPCDDQGRFILEDLAPGLWRLGAGRSELLFPDVLTSRATASCWVVEGERHRVELRAGDPGLNVLEGRLRVTGARPDRLLVFCDDKPDRAWVVDPDGRFVVPCDGAGVQRLRVQLDALILVIPVRLSGERGLADIDLPLGRLAGRLGADAAPLVLSGSVAGADLGFEATLPVAGGRYELIVPAGQLRLSARPARGEAVLRSVSVPAGGVVELDLP